MNKKVILFFLILLINNFNLFTIDNSDDIKLKKIINEEIKKEISDKYLGVYEQTVNSFNLFLIMLSIIVVIFVGIGTIVIPLVVPKSIMKSAELKINRMNIKLNRNLNKIQDKIKSTENEYEIKINKSYENLNEIIKNDIDKIKEEFEGDNFQIIGTTYENFADVLEKISSQNSETEKKMVYDIINYYLSAFNYTHLSKRTILSKLLLKKINSQISKIKSIDIEIDKIEIKSIIEYIDDIKDKLDYEKYEDQADKLTEIQKELEDVCS